MDPAITPLFIFGAVFILLAVIVINSRKKKPIQKRYHSIGRHPYVSGEFSPQMELDMRLPYRRFKQLYPSSTLTYAEYKKLQMQTAFRRSTSSQENQRMVR